MYQNFQRRVVQKPPQVSEWLLYGCFKCSDSIALRADDCPGLESCCFPDHTHIEHISTERWSQQRDGHCIQSVVYEVEKMEPSSVCLNLDSRALQQLPAKCEKGENWRVRTGKAASRRRNGFTGNQLGMLP